MAQRKSFLILQITPSWPPQIGGVGDYACMLESALLAKGVKSTALVPDFQGLRSVLFASETGTRAARHLIEATDAQTLLLHFSGYGYASRGLCLSLARAVSQWRQADCTRRFVVVFHEVYASGPPWRSAFWTALPQRHAARMIAMSADKILTTSSTGEKQLKRMGASAEYWPVFSNIGETDTPTPLGERADYAVVFGLPGRRRATYMALTASLEAAEGLRALGIKSILDIGPGEEAQPIVHGLTVKVCGALPANEIHDILLKARIGLVDYPMHVITKSGIVAAYLAHGLLVVNTANASSKVRDFVEGVHFANPIRLLSPDFNAEAIAQGGHLWYRAHNLKKTADRILSLIE